MSEVGYMSYLFRDHENCNPDIGNWDVSGVWAFVSEEMIVIILQPIIMNSYYFLVFELIYYRIFLMSIVITLCYDHIISYRLECSMVHHHSTKTLGIGMYPIVKA